MVLLLATPFPIRTMDDIKKIHKNLFGKVYEWAGQLREIPIIKSGRKFVKPERFAQACENIDSILEKYTETNRDNKPHLVATLAKLLNDLNNFHPFREGNGRTQRQTLSMLAQEKGWHLNLEQAGVDDAYMDYMKGTIDGDSNLLAKTISYHMEEMEQ